MLTDEKLSSSLNMKILSYADGSTFYIPERAIADTKVSRSNHGELYSSLQLRCAPLSCAQE